MGVTISIAETPEERRQAYRLRYRVFVEELRYEVPGATPEEGLIDPTDEQALLFVAFDGDAPVATVALDSWDRVDIPSSTIERFQLQRFESTYGRDSVLIVRKLMALESQRGSGLVLRLLLHAMKAALEPKLDFVICEASPYLVRYYENLGLRRYAPHFVYGDSGIISVPLCLVLHDHYHLEAVNSPILALLKGKEIHDDPQVRAFFKANWGARSIDPSQAEPAPEPSPGDVEFDHHILFADMTEAERRTMLELVEPVDFVRGQLLIEQNAEERDVYALTSGYLEVVIDRGGDALAIATLGPGEILGEMAHLLRTSRSSKVTAITEGRMYRISSRALDALSTKAPTLATKVYQAMARTLALRLRSVSHWVTNAPPL